jgi:site-specific recombinase XerD
VPLYDLALARKLRVLVCSENMPTRQQLWSQVTRAVRLCGFSDELNFHALRHTAATRLIQRGINLRIMQKFLGHRSVQTTLEYAHVADDDLMKAAEKLSPRAGYEAEQGANMVEIVRLKAQ